MPSRKEKLVIGRNDHIDLPDMQLFEINAKVDTGAYSCALHCHEIEVVELDGVETLKFRLLDPEHPDYNGKAIKFTEFETKRVKNSFGETEERFVIKSTIHMFGQDFLTDFTLTNRQQMRYPVLLGRKLLQHGIIVDVAKKDLSFKLKKKNTESANKK